MELHADFSQRVVVDSATLPWLPSPMAGVERRMLDRIGDEVARATSIVRYAPGSHFSSHVHSGGEEFIVLEGVFQDEHGDYPAGTYVRNPPTSKHTPGSKPGCTIFVKLWQFDTSDRTYVRTPGERLFGIPHADRPGIQVSPLYKDPRETVQFETWNAGARSELLAPLGAELLVLEGTLEDSGDTLGKHAWLRIPPGGRLRAQAGASGARIWLKTGHLGDVRAPGR